MTKMEFILIYFLLVQAQAANVLGCTIEVFTPRHLSRSKLDMLDGSGARVTLHGNDCLEAELKARQTAEVHTYLYTRLLQFLVHLCVYCW